MARKARRVEDLPVESPNLTTFSDVTFQLLIFFMLTIKFKQEEGHLLSMLPLRGIVDKPVDIIDVQEVRLFICADSATGRFDQHIGAKESHQQSIAALKRADPSVGDVCLAWIEQTCLQNQTTPLYRSERFASRSAENKRQYLALADQAKTLRDKLKAVNPRSKVPIIIDCDGLVPWEHPFGLLNALQKRGINDVEWAGNPRFDRYFGSTDGK